MIEKLPKQKWTIEPGDGTGCSISDALVRNSWGVCSVLGCGQKLNEDAVGRGLYCKLCPQHEKELDECTQKITKEYIDEVDAWAIYYSKLINSA